MSVLDWSTNTGLDIALAKNFFLALAFLSQMETKMRERGWRAFCQNSLFRWTLVLSQQINCKGCFIQPLSPPKCLIISVGRSISGASSHRNKSDMHVMVRTAGLFSWSRWISSDAILLNNCPPKALVTWLLLPFIPFYPSQDKNPCLFTLSLLDLVLLILQPYLAIWGSMFLHPSVQG